MISAQVIWETAEGVPVPNLGTVEVGGFAFVGGRYVLLGGRPAEMWALVADAPTGPFRAASRTAEKSKFDGVVRSGASRRRRGVQPGGAPLQRISSNDPFFTEIEEFLMPVCASG